MLPPVADDADVARSGAWVAFTAQAGAIEDGAIFATRQSPAKNVSLEPNMNISQIRIARPTDRLDELVRFYRDGLGFAVIGQFRDHDGYDGVMLALPGRRDHIEFTSHRDGSPCRAPSDDNLLVLYIPEPTELAALKTHLGSLGIDPVKPENPYWSEMNATTFADPDGWRVVLFPGAGL